MTNIIVNGIQSIGGIYSAGFGICIFLIASIFFFVAIHYFVVYMFYDDDSTVMIKTSNNVNSAVYKSYSFAEIMMYLFLGLTIAIPLFVLIWQCFVVHNDKFAMFAILAGSEKLFYSLMK